MSRSLVDLDGVESGMPLLRLYSYYKLVRMFIDTWRFVRDDPDAQRILFGHGVTQDEFQQEVEGSHPSPTPVRHRGAGSETKNHR